LQRISDSDEGYILHDDRVKRAPEALALLQAFVNTAYGQQQYQHQVISDSLQLRAWLAQQGLMGPEEPATEGDLRRALALREALRGLLRANNAGPPVAAEMLDMLHHIARLAPLAVHVSPDGTATFVPTVGGVDGALARLVSQIPLTQADGTWPRLKACRNDRCGRAFYDTSKNHSAIWCASTTCGNRIHARAFRQRQRTQQLDGE
jgi:predicted RNA-binding Zn ribbon-like protein